MEYQNKLHSYLERIIKEEGSDIHLSVGRHPMVRVSGLLVPLVDEAELSDKDLEGFVDVLLDEKGKTEFMGNKELDFSYTYDQKARFRCNCFFQRGSMAVAMRLIPAEIRSLEELNLPAVLAEFAQHHQGFFLVVGPVGHGKTTTLASLVELINQNRTEHIITIEDPIEYVFDQKKSIIDQREVGVDTESFSTALTQTFRQDVDVIMVGEMRDRETISTAVTAAETGHLVFSTLHTNNASQTIDRIIDTFPAEQQDQIRVQLASSLSGIFSQRLLPRTSGGVIPAYELLINNNAVANLIREGRTHEIDSVVETGSGDGMINLNRSLVERVRSGEVALEDARHYALNPKLFERML